MVVGKKEQNLVYYNIFEVGPGSTAAAISENWLEMKEP